ncbi:MAG TPA: phosphatase domain-containing protein [Longilinea sp.]|nr:phosphatase domain-containing protein [Longilinea sp.]
MSKWQKNLAPLANDVEEFVDRIKRRLEGRFSGPEPTMVVPLAAFTYPGGFYIKGRILHQSHPIISADNQSVWDDLLDFYHRMNSDEIPNARLRLLAGSETFYLESDEEGYFELNTSFSTSQPHPKSVQLEWLTESETDPTKEPAKTAEVMVPLVHFSNAVRYGVISDVDDTLLVSNVQNPFGLIRTLVSGRASQRSAFPGVPAFYRGLQAGGNPLFFVSSSPWNLSDLLEETFDYHGLPEHVTFLRDWAISDQEILPTDNVDYKLGMLRLITSLFPDLPFLLIGDSGQQDPEIYARFILENPGRILGVYIRDVSPDDRRDAAVHQLKTSGVPLLLAVDSFSMARDAVARGWLNPEVVSEIEADQSRSGSGG